jgi:hypothetical protein
MILGMFHIQNKKRVPNAEPGQIDSFWHHAILEKTYKRDHKRNALTRCKYDLVFGRGIFRARRIYKDQRTGERRETIELYDNGFNTKIPKEER